MKRDRLTKKFIVGILFVFLPMVGTYAQTWKGTVDNNWSTPGNWFPNGLPGNLADVVFDATSNVSCTIDVAVNINSITVSGYTNTITQTPGVSVTTANLGTTTTNTFTSGTFTGSSNGTSPTNDITFNGSIQINGGTFNSTAATLYVGGNFNFSSGSFNANSGTVIMTGMNSSISGTTTFNNLTVGQANSSNYTCSFNNSFTVGGNLTLIAPGSGSNNLTLNTPSGGKASILGNLIYNSSGGGNIIINNNGALELAGSNSALDLSPASASTTGGGSGTIQFNGPNAGASQKIIGTTAFKNLLPNINIIGLGTLNLLSTITVVGNWLITNNTSIAYGTSKVIFNPSSIVTVSNSISSWGLYDANVIGAGGSGRVNFINQIPTINHLFTIGQNVPTTVSFNNSVINVSALKTQGSSPLAILNGTINITGAGSSLNIAGTGGTATITNTDVLGTVKFSGSSTVTNSGGVSVTTGALPNILIAGNVDLGSSTIIPVSGNWTYTSGAVTPNTSKVSFTGGTNQTITSTGMSFNNIDLEASVILSSDLSLNGNITGASGVNLDPSISAYNINIKGDWNIPTVKYNSNSYHTASGPTVTFNGTSNQNVNAYYSYGFYNLTVANSSGITLQTPVDVDGTLTLTSGKITTTATTYLNLNIGSASSSTGIGSTNSYVNGPMQWTINAQGGFPQTVVCNFPIGGTDWSPISLSLDISSANQTIYSAQMFNSSPITTFSGASYTLNSPIQKISNVRYWKVSQTNSNSNGVRLTAYYNTNDQVTDLPNLSIARATTSSGPWQNQTIATRTASYIATNTIALISNGSPDIFTFDDTGTGANPLPITVSSFKAAYDNTRTAVNVQWTTESEEAGTYFTVERADKSLAFEALTTIKPPYGDGKNGREQYSYVDHHPLDGLSYYRLKQTGKDGAISYNSVVSVNSQVDRIAGVYPNPGDGALLHLVIPHSLQQEQQVALTIRNQLGEVIVNDVVSAYGRDEIDLSLESPLPKGIYFVSFGGGAIVYSLKYIAR